MIIVYCSIPGNKTDFVRSLYSEKVMEALVACFSLPAAGPSACVWLVPGTEA